MAPGISRCGPVSEPLAVARAAELDLIAIHSGGERLDLFAMASAILGRVTGPGAKRMASDSDPRQTPIVIDWPLWNLACGGQLGLWMCMRAPDGTTASATTPPKL